MLAREGRWCWTTGASVWKPPRERCWQRGGDIWPWHKGVPSHACPTRAPMGAQHCHQPGWRFSSQFLALRGISRFSTNAQTQPWVTPPSTTPGAPGPHQTPPKMQSQARDELRCSQHTLQLPQTPTASSGCTSPAEDTHGTQAGSPRPSPECVVYSHIGIKEIALIMGEKGKLSLPTKAACGTDTFWRHPPAIPFP